MQFWMAVGSSCVALAGMLLTVPMRTVQADALLSQPAATSTSAASSTSVVAQPTPALTFTEHGVASWYGSAFNGRLTASGERYNMHSMTACHPTLPFGTRVKVTNVKNHRSVVVRINDRGYLYDHRIIDLSYGAAQKLHMTDAGLANVVVTVLPPKPGKS
ncbi:MAG: septal ring lytic transglycosylase RlpA family protein [Acidobacteriota bacterium]|nr:septal ring lytic transglycosylase RlpA family protein [Acidobacteriota bacterium]